MNTAASHRKQAIVRGSIASYRQWGNDDKPVLLALHGWADTADTFKLLASAIGDVYCIIAPDLPGFGGTQLPNDQIFTLDLYVDWITDFCKKIDIRPYGMIGHSNGGAITIKAAARGALDAQKIILIASAGIRSEQKIKKKLLATAAKPVKLGLRVLPESQVQAVKKKAYGAIGSDYMVSESMKGTFKNIVAEDVLGEARNILQPTLLLYGDKDADAPARFGQAFHEQITDSTLKVVPDVGHFVHQEQCELVAQLILDFAERSK